MNNSDIIKKMKQAAKWSSITEIAAKLVAPVTNMILARVLVPEDFGMVATLTMVVSFAEIFTDAGFQKYLVQHEFEDEYDFNISTNVAFWTNFLLSLLIWCVIAYFSAPISNIVGSEGAGLGIVVMSAEIPMLAFSSIQMSRYRREFDFKTLFIVRMITALVPLVVTVPLAILFHNYWALIVGTLARDLLNAIILTIKSEWKPKFQYSFTKLKEMVSFSLWTVIENISIWVTGNIGLFIVGNYLNAHYLGLYKISISTSGSYMGLITSATTPVLFSALSRCQSNEDEFNDIFLRFQRMVAMLVFPLGFGIYIYRDIVTLILLGNQWMEAADFIGMWSLSSALTIIFSHYNSEVFRSKGRPKLSVWTQILHLVVLVPILLWSAKQGFRFLTIAHCVVRIENIFVSCIIIQYFFGIRFMEILKNVWPSLTAATIMAVAGSLLRQCCIGLLWEIITIFLCVLIYITVMAVIPAGRKQLTEIPILQKLSHLISMEDKK